MDGADEDTDESSSEGSDQDITSQNKDGVVTASSRHNLHQRLREGDRSRLSPRQGAMLLQDDDDDDDDDDDLDSDQNDDDGVDANIIKTTMTQKTREREVEKKAKRKGRKEKRQLLRKDSTLELALGTYVDVLDACNVWREAKIVDKREGESGREMEVQIGYIGWLHHWDEWLPVSSHRIQPYHSKTVEGLGTEYVDAPSSDECTTASEGELEKYDPAALLLLKQVSRKRTSRLIAGAREGDGGARAAAGEGEGEGEGEEEYTAETVIREMRRRAQKRRAGMSWVEFLIYDPDFAMTMGGALGLLIFVLLFHQVRAACCSSTLKARISLRAGAAIDRHVVVMVGLVIAQV
jgi:hypothetical protein